MAANKDFIDILREIRGSGIPGEAYTDGIWYELTIADRNSNPGIYGDILSKYGIIVEHVDTFAQAVSILEKLNVEITTLPAGSEATSALVYGVWQLGIPIGTPGIDGLDGFTPNIAINYTLGKLNCVITVDNVQVVNTTLVNLDELVNTVVNANVDVQTTLEAKQLIIDSVETVQEIADGLNENVANKIIELSNHTIAKLDELNAASTAEQLEITNTANVEKLAFGQSVTTKVTQYNENHVAKLAEYDANDELKIEQYNSNHTERLENLDEKYATRIIDMLNTNKILGMVDKFAVTTPTQYASFIDTNIGSYIYYLNGHMLQNIVDYTVVNDTTIELVASLSYGDIITQVDSSYIGDYLTFSGVILEERIDQPNGVAGLDENGKLLPGILAQDVNNRFVTDTEKSTWNGKASTSIATTVANGLMSSTDKTKLDDIIGTNTGDQTTIIGNAGTATKLQTPRAIQVSGAVTGTADFDGDAAINIVTTNTATPVITLAGDATGSVTLANLSSGTLTVSIVDDSHNHVISNIDGLQTAIDAKVDDTEKGVANGIATLDANGKVVLSQINDSILGQLEYKGVWNLATMPTATEKGQYWIASAAGNGYEVGDWAVYNGATFDKVDNTDAVASVAGRTGVVVLTKTDVGLNNVDNTTDATKNVLSATKWTDGRTITIGSTGKSVDGSSDVSWSLAEIGAQAAGSYQTQDATLTALASVVTAADKLVYATGVDAFTTTALTAAGRALLDDTDAAAQRATLEISATNTPSTAVGGIIATNVQAAIAELDSEKVAKVTSTDNAIARFDGTTGAIQNSSVVIDDSNNMSTTGTVQGTQLKSTIADGTAPLTVASTTLVTNLNADLLDGNHASAFSLTSHTHSYEAPITAGTTAQYYRGDKTWQTLNSTAVGLGNVTNAAQMTTAHAANAITGLATTTTSLSSGGTGVQGTSTVIARADHTHTLPAYPTTLPASDVYAWAKASTKPSYIFSEIGTKPTTLSGYGITDASLSNHTHNYAGSSSAGGSATSVANSCILKFDTGAVEGTSLYTFNGSTAKTIDIKAGTNVTLTKASGVITISSTDTNTTYTFATGTTNGTFNVTPSGGSLTPISIYGLGTAAYTASTAYATSAHTHPSLSDNVHYLTQDFCQQANTLVSGGGTIAVDATGYVKWSERFIVISSGRHADYSAESGYFDITCPTSGTITGVGGATNKTATASGIPLATFETLYYILPIGATSASVPANFRVVGYTANVDIPATWIKIAKMHDATPTYVDFANGVSLKLNESLNSETYDVMNAYKAAILETTRTINGVSFNGSANINIEDRLGTAIASAATVTIGTAGLGDYIHITGTATITSFGTAATAGIRRTLIFDGALTLTHNATSLICIGSANIVTSAGMVIEVVAETTANWRVVSITKKSVIESKVTMAANNIDLSAGNIFTKTVAATTTFTVSGVQPTGNANSFILELTNGGAYAITWWSGIKWAGGTVPTLTASGVDILGFYSHDGGTTYRGIVLAKDSK